jgi:hypothetical protein
MNKSPTAPLQLSAGFEWLLPYDGQHALILGDVRKSAQRKLDGLLWQEWASQSTSQNQFSNSDISDFCKELMSCSSKINTSFIIQYLCDCLHWYQDYDKDGSSMFQLICPYHQQAEDQPILNVDHFINCHRLLSGSRRQQLKHDVVRLLNSLSESAQSWARSHCSSDEDISYILCRLFAPGSMDKSQLSSWSDRNRICLGAFSNSRASHIFSSCFGITDKDVIQHTISKIRKTIVSHFQSEYMYLCTHDINQANST